MSYPGPTARLARLTNGFKKKKKKKYKERGSEVDTGS